MESACIKKEENITPDLFLAVCIRDLFMERVLDNATWSLFDPDECPGLLNAFESDYRKLYLHYEQTGKAKKVIPAQELLVHLAKCRIESGMPYMFNIDMTNRKSAQKNIGFIRSSNLCVAPETLVLTDKGHIEIQKLKDKEVNVWNGKEFSPVTVKQTSDNSELITVKFSDGSELTCTKYHKFYIQTDSIDQIKAQNLKPGMKLIKCDYPVIDSEKELKCLYHHIHTGSVGRNKKIFVPINYYSLKSKLKWFAELYESNWSLLTCDNDQILRINNLPRKFLLQVKLMLQTCGIESKVEKVNYSENIRIRKCIKSRIYKRKIVWRLLISSNNSQKLKNLRFDPERSIYNKPDSERNDTSTSPQESEFVKVVNINDNNRKDKTFCFNEEKRHAGIFNGIITSNCTEIVEFSNSSEYACCVLASICLPKFVEDTHETPNDEFPKTPHFNFTKLTEVVKVAFRNLDNIIDLNWYPVPETEVSNKRHRPIGLGVQGLADVYHKMKIAFDSPMAYELNKRIFEAIYYACMVESCQLAREEYLKYKKTLAQKGTVNIITGYRIRRSYATLDDEENNNYNEYVEEIYKTISKESLDISDGSSALPTTCGAYSSYARPDASGLGSPISQGKFQFDLWDEELKILTAQNPHHWKDQDSAGCIQSENTKLSNMWDWKSLKLKIKNFGVRNSLTTALMPTASTSQIMGNNESFEPYTSNIYRRETMAGQFVCINKYLMHELLSLGIWNEDVEKNIRTNNGSVQHIEGLPTELKERYKTNWEISQKVVIDQEADRGRFIDQSQSANRFLSRHKASIANVTAMDIYAWRKRLKTGQYYLRTEDFNDPQKFTIEPDQIKLDEYEESKKDIERENIFTVNDKNKCLSCEG